MLRVLGRIDDAISTGGLTVFPQLVETALASHPRVADCAVFGVSDERLGQRGVAAGVAADSSAPPTLAELRTHIAQTLDSTAAPKEVHIVDELPRRGIGKVDRRQLAAQFGG
jgi:O-succinylbenzoic acid--CoA ligase